jgi:hypothetical protein
MADTGTRGGLGWVILVAALAVPGVLFYNWWSHLKADREKAVAAKARGRVPEGGVFQSPPSAKLVNPMDTTVSTVPVVRAPVDASSAVVVARPAPVADTVPAPAPTGAAPPLKRDPTLSPFDQVRLMEEDEARRRAAEELENLKNRKIAPKVVKRVDPKTLVDLQGIISNPESGYKAIVNNEVVGIGELVGKVRIVRITEGGVVFDYKGQKFTKTVSRDE